MVDLQLDTDILRSAVSSAQNASEMINDAMILLNSIAIHDDWECKERNTITNYTLQNRAKIGEIDEKARVFYDRINQAANRFEEEEQRQITAQESVESIIAQIHNVAVGGSSGGISIAKYPNLKG